MNFDFLFLLNTEQQILLVAFIIIFLIQAGYYIFLFSKVAFYKTKGFDLTDISEEPVSVVICARNESEKLRNLLPKLLEQGHPQFEVIVVNNCSTDDSSEVLQLLQSQYQHLVVRTIDLDEVFSHNNSMAWGVGIKAARYEWIVLTDINCFPENENWLAALQQNFRKNIEVVISYTKFEYNKIARADSFFEALYFLSKARSKKPYLGLGSNLAFRKSLFFNNKGFNPQISLYDKADRIFVNAIANGSNTAVDLSFDAVNKSSLKLNYLSWRLKRRDELHSQRLFRDGTKNKGCFEMAIRVVYYVLFVVTLIWVINVQWAWITVLSAFGLRLLLQLVIFVKAQKRLKENGLLITSLIWDLISPLIYIPVIISSKKRRG